MALDELLDLRDEVDASGDSWISVVGIDWERGISVPTINEPERLVIRLHSQNGSRLVARGRVYVEGVRNYVLRDANGGGIDFRAAPEHPAIRECTWADPRNSVHTVRENAVGLKGAPMRKKRFTDEQIVRLLREQEASGEKVQEFCRKQSLATATF